MNLLYLDESGDPFGWKQQRNFVLGGIAVHETQIYRLSSKLDQLQNEYFPDRQIPVEFHVTQIRNRKDEFASFSEDEREEIISKVYNILAKRGFPGIILFASSLDVSALPSRAAATQICFENICKNFNLSLYHSMMYARKREKPFSKGLVIIDRGRENRYLQLFDEFRRSEEVEGYLANIVDIPYFGACSDTRMLQYADFVSNAVWRYYEYGDSEHIDKIKHLFYYGSKNWAVPGLNHITKLECDCYSCSFKNANGIT